MTDAVTHPPGERTGLRALIDDFNRWRAVRLLEKAWKAWPLVTADDRRVHFQFMQVSLAMGAACAPEGGVQPSVRP
jgi:hypothetical protein